jgi:hypothetical protein
MENVVGFTNRRRVAEKRRGVVLGKMTLIYLEQDNNFHCGISEKRMTSKSDKKRTGDGRDLAIRYYIVCLIDLLGQKEKLKGWSRLSQDGKPTPDSLSALQRSLGTLLWFKEKFSEFFNQFETSHLSQQQLNMLTPQQHALFARFKKSTLYIQQFSDTFVFFAPISNEHGDLMIDPLYRILTAASMAMLVSLAAKLPLRGAISMGSGAQIEPGNLYGPALAQAHHIESTIAQSPRIVVDNEVVKFLAASGGYSDESMINTATVQLAATCRSLITPDTDNHVIVDFLGQIMKTISGDEDKAIGDTVRLAFDFVRQEHARFVKTSDGKLEQRYATLLKYMTSRIPIWGIAP